VPPTAIFSNGTFTYDGDSNRVKSVITTNIGTTTTYFVGNYYEVSGSTITKYYYASAQRIAMRTGGTLNFIIGDHLGSTSLTTDANGVVVSEMKYKAWGEERYSSGNSSTNYTYTGQYSYASDFGLMYYGARWYDDTLGRFSSADTIIPGTGNPQAWDRYAYVHNNPLAYTDPTGQDPIPEFIDGFLLEFGRTLLWFSPYHQEVGAIHEDESDAMLAGRLVADVASIAIGGLGIGTGSGAIGGGGLACVTGVGCPAGGAEAIALGGVLIAQGAGMGVRGAEGGAAILAMLSKKYRRSESGGTDITKRPSGYRKPVKSEVESQAPLDDSGDMICMGCGKKMQNPTMDHYPPGWKRIQNIIFGSRREVLNEWNNIDRLRPLCLKCNISHRFENIPTEKLPFYRRGR